MAQAVRVPCQTEKACFRLEVIPSGNCSVQGGTETGFLLVLRFYSRHGSDEDLPTSQSEGLGSKTVCYELPSSEVVKW